MKLLKFITLQVLLLGVLLTSIGVSSYKHLCLIPCEEIEVVENQSVKTCCESISDEPIECCKDEITIVQVQQVSQKVKNNDLEKLVSGSVVLLANVLFPSHFSDNNNSLHFYHPPNLKTDRQSKLRLFCTFLI